jgi:hypothetical protein
MILSRLYDTHQYTGSRWTARPFRASSPKIYLSGVYYGATKSNVVFAQNNFLSADEIKSRRCLELTLKVVVVIYVVEDKIVVILHYI